MLETGGRWHKKRKMEDLISVYNEISEVAKLIHEKGWAERNAGNFSYRIDSKIKSENVNEHKLSVAYPMLSGCCFIITGKGTRMRDIAKSPESNTSVIKLNKQGDSYGYVSGNIPVTSELITHLAIHNMIAERGSNERAIMHSHVTELIAITHVDEYCNQENLNNLLWSMHPETIMFIPEGVGFVPFEIPGSEKIAQLTVEALKSHHIALWEKHGVFSIADNLNECYDLLDIAAKSVKIFFMCAEIGKDSIGLSKSQISKLTNSFKGL